MIGYVIILESRTGSIKTTQKITCYTFKDAIDHLKQVNYSALYVSYFGLERRQGYYTQDRRKRDRRNK